MPYYDDMRQGEQNGTGEPKEGKPPVYPEEDSLARELRGLAYDLGQLGTAVGGTILHEARRGMKNYSQRMKPQYPWEDSVRWEATMRSTGETARRIGMLVAGYIGLGLCVSFLIACISCAGAAAVPTVAAEEMYVLRLLAVIFAAVTGGMGWLGAWGLRGAKLLSLRKTYLGVIGEDAAAPVSRLAEAAQRPLKRVRKDLKKMIRKGLLPNGYLDEETDTFFTDVAEYRRLQQLQEAAKRTAEKEQTEQPEQTGSPDTMAAFQQQGRRFVARLHRSAAGTDEQMREELQEMETTCTGILSWVEKHPDALPKMRRLSEYYIPTTQKMLDTCADIEGQHSQAAERIRTDVTGILHTLNKAYAQMRDELLQATGDDIYSEISAMKTMLHQDGLADSDFTIK